MASGGEDNAFLNQFGANRVLLHSTTDWFPGLGLHVAFCHGVNLKSQDKFLGRYAAPEHDDRRQPEFTEDLIDYLRAVLDVYGMGIAAYPASRPIFPPAS